jgi:ankyrin repeat protein
MRRTRKNGGMIRALQQISKQRQPSIASESRPKHKTSSLRNRIHDAIITAQNVYPVAKPVAEPVTEPVVAESSNIPVAHAVPVKESNVTSSLNEMIVDKKIYSDKPLINPVTNPASKPQAKPVEANPQAKPVEAKPLNKPLNNSLNPILKPLQGKSSEKASMSMDNLEQIMNDMKPKPPSNKKVSENPRIKPLPPKGPLPKEYVEALGKIMPPKPPPRIEPKITKKEASLLSLVKAILEDDIKILTEAEPNPNKTPEVDTTTISRFYMERIQASKMKDSELLVEMSGLTQHGVEKIGITIPLIKLNNCIPLLVATKFGMMRPCKQIMEAVDDMKKKEMLTDFDDDGNTPLSLCAEYGYQELCEYFISEHQRLGIDLEGLDMNRNKNIPEKARINELLKENKMAELSLDSAYADFIEAYKKIDDYKMKYKLELKKLSNVSMRGNSFKKTPLMVAAENGHLGIVELLLCGGRVNNLLEIEKKQQKIQIRAITQSQRLLDTGKTKSNRKTKKRTLHNGAELRNQQELDRTCANPHAMNDYGQTALHLCVRNCCPSKTMYKSVFYDSDSNSDVNGNPRYQYNLVNDDKYKKEAPIWRFTRTIHLLLRFMIFDKGVIGGPYRPNGLKIVLQNEYRYDILLDDEIDIWSATANNGNGAFDTFCFSGKTNWISFFQLRKENPYLETISEYENPQKQYLSAFITSRNGKLKIKENVFDHPGEKCFFVQNDPNMFIEMEKCFNKNVYDKKKLYQNNVTGKLLKSTNIIHDFATYFEHNLYKKVFYPELKSYENVNLDVEDNKDDSVSLNDINERAIEYMRSGRDEYKGVYNLRRRI